MVQQQLVNILADGNWHDVAGLRSACGLSEAALRAELSCLEPLGLPVVQDQQRGYRLAEPLRLLSRDQVLAALEHSLRERLSVFDLQLVIDSTNTQAMRWLQGGAAGFGVFLAEKQERGKGRRGRTWVSPLARNIYLTLVWPVPGLQAALGGLSLVTALSLVDALRGTSLRGTEALRVKWPNDLWMNDAKLAGILLEYRAAQNGAGHVVIGIGVNVHLPDSDRQGIAQPVTDLHSAGNRDVDRNALVAGILNCLCANLEQFLASGFEPFRKRWSPLDALHGRQVAIHGGGRDLTGRVCGVSDSGALVLQTPQGEQLVHGGEITPSVRAL